jgi:hypothetical protein
MKPWIVASLREFLQEMPEERTHLTKPFILLQLRIILRDDFLMRRTQVATDRVREQFRLRK